MGGDANPRASKCGRAWLLFAIAYALVCACMPGAAALSRKDVDVEALEKAWETNDSPLELKSDADWQYEKLSAASERDAKVLGPQMVFVTLQTQEPLDALASRWKTMLWNGHVEANIYELEAAKVLVGIQKGEYMRELRVFLKSQPEVREYEWNSRKYNRNDPVEDLPLPTTTTTKRGKDKKRKKSKKKATMKESL